MYKKIICSWLCVLTLAIGGITPAWATNAETTEAVTEEGASENIDGEETTEEEEPVDPNPPAFYEPVQTDSIEGWPAGPAIWAESAVVMDLDSGAILYAKNMDAVKYPASITKIMTTLLAAEHSRLDERVIFSEHAIYGIERDSSHIGIRVNENLSMKDCLYGMMLESANEVCLAVAEHISGSEEGFVELMNQEAAQLGCTNTHFANPNGLPDETHYTTAHDMALIARAAYENPIFRKVCQTTIYSIGTTNVCGEVRWLNNHHKMLPDGLYFYEGCTGGKTGFTQAALNTLVTYAERNGRRLVCVSLRTNGARVYEDTAALLDYGFNNFQNVTMYSRDNDPNNRFLYPTFYFGPSVTLNTLRSDCVATIPITASADQITATASSDENTITRTYQFGGHPVGSESIPLSGSTTLLTAYMDRIPQPAPEKVMDKVETTVSNLTESPKKTLVALISYIAALPVYVLILLGLVLLLLILEIILMIRRSKRRRRRRQQKGK